MNPATAAAFEGMMQQKQVSLTPLSLARYIPSMASPPAAPSAPTLDLTRIWSGPSHVWLGTSLY